MAAPGDVVITDDAAEVLHEAGSFLKAKPSHHNLLLSLLEERAAHPEPGRFWWATDDGAVVAVMFQSPLDFHATISPTVASAVDALAAHAADVAPDLPGVMGDAATAALFAGTWAELRKTPAMPAEGQRLYELGQLQHPDGVAGALRSACPADVDTVLAWLRAFELETGGRVSPPDTLRRRIDGGLVWIWENDGSPVGSAAFTPPVAGVSRVGLVYTPPEHRGRGYAAACTAAVSETALRSGADRCVLYTQLSNPVSNAIYRRLGYEPISEQIHYRFG
jgi:predicted GNAT family acetyltransferase